MAPSKIPCGSSPITHIRVTRKQFEDLGINIGEFTKAFIRANSRRGSEVFQADVMNNWILEVQNAYNKGEPACTRLLGQLHCPLIDTFWQQRTNMEACKTMRLQQNITGFRPFGRRPTEDELHRNRGIVVFTGLGQDLVVPNVGFLPLQSVNFLTVARDVIEYNPNGLEHKTMRDLWHAIVDKAYYYELEDLRSEKREEGFAVTCSDFANLKEDAGQTKKRKAPCVEDAEHVLPEDAPNSHNKSIGAVGKTKLESLPSDDPKLKRIMIKEESKSYSVDAEFSELKEGEQQTASAGCSATNFTTDSGEGQKKRKSKGPSIAELVAIKPLPVTTFDNLEAANARVVELAHALNSAILKLSSWRPQVQAAERDLQKLRLENAELMKRLAKLESKV